MKQRLEWIAALLCHARPQALRRARGLARRPVLLALLAAGCVARAVAQAPAEPAVAPAAPAAMPAVAPTVAPTVAPSVTPPVAAAAPLACEPHLSNPQFRRLEAQTISGTRYALAWIAQPDVRAGEFFTLEVAVCAAPGQPAPRTLRVDASMPEHQHGMNYRASVRPRGPGRFVAEGLLLHMSGRWQFSFEINVGAQREVLTGDVQVN